MKNSRSNRCTSKVCMLGEGLNQPLSLTLSLGERTNDKITPSPNIGEGRGEVKNAAFTLAEVLITLGVIGVVAAITMPMLITNVNERINSNRQANIAYKVTQAMDKMKAMGLLNGSYATTDQFVDELQKHLKIAKRCNANNIADCWPTDKVMTGDGKEFDVSKTKTGKNLSIKNNTSNNVGLVLADGSSLILTYNQDASPIDVGDKTTSEFRSLPVGFGKSKEFAYTTSNTASIDFVMDVNGKKGPNSETLNNKFHDIRSFKAAKFAKGCAGVEIPGVGCVVNIGTSYSCLEFGSEDQKKWDPKYNPDDPYNTGGPTCWGGARKACDDIGMSLPDIGTLSAIIQSRYRYPDLPLSGSFWSSTEEFSYTVWHISTFDEHPIITFWKEDHGNGALCVGE